MSTNLEYRARERERKRESRRQAAKLNEKKGDRNLQREIKKRKETFFGRKDNMKILQLRLPIKCKMKMSGSEKSEREHVRHFLH